MPLTTAACPATLFPHMGLRAAEGPRPPGENTMATTGDRNGGLRNEFSWSHSRFETFRECLRRYYYHYYAYWGGWSPDADPLARRLYILRNLKNRYLWAGAIVHDAVAGILERVRARLPEPDPTEAADQALQRMRAEFRQSRDGAYLQDPKRATGLVEHHYREAVSDEEWRGFAEMVRRSIHGFAQGPFLAAARELASEDWLSLEELLNFEIDGAKVYVKMDLAHRRPDGGAVILDWKTGKRRPQPEGLQLGCYALYASQAWDIPPERIQVIEANIHTGAVGSAMLSAEHLEKARAEISAGIGQMRERLADPESNTARAEDFPASPSGPTCRRCVFRELCPDYQALAEARGQSAQPSAHWG